MGSYACSQDLCQLATGTLALLASEATCALPSCCSARASAMSMFTSSAGLADAIDRCHTIHLSPTRCVAVTSPTMRAEEPCGMVCGAAAVRLYVVEEHTRLVACITRTGKQRQVSTQSLCPVLRAVCTYLLRQAIAQRHVHAVAGCIFQVAYGMRSAELPAREQCFSEAAVPHLPQAELPLQRTREAQRCPGRSGRQGTAGRAVRASQPQACRATA